MSNNIDIIFLGDSLTFGYGVSKNNSWVYKLTEKLSFSALNKAHNGETTTSMLTRYYNDVLVYSPRKVFIMGGTNDLLLGRPVSSIIDNIELMIKDGIDINSEITIGIPPRIIGKIANDLFSPSHLYKYAEDALLVLKEQLIILCNKYKLSFIDFYNLTLDKNDIYLDGLHLTSQGHELMYEEALLHYKGVKKNLK